MQMNGSGIICTGYMYYNPSVQDLGTVGVTIDTSTMKGPTLNFSPEIGKVGQVTVRNDNNTFLSSVSYKLIFNGYYLGFGSSSTESNISISGSFTRENSGEGIGATRTHSTFPKVRYA